MGRGCSTGCTRVHVHVVLARSSEGCNSPLCRRRPASGYSGFRCRSHAHTEAELATQLTHAMSAVWGGDDGKGEVGPWLIECVFDSAGAKL